MAEKAKIKVEGQLIRLERIDKSDFISLTDIVKNNSAAEPSSVIANWLRNQNTISFLEAWEETFSPDFKPSQMIGFRKFATDNRALITTKKYIELSGATGIISKSGRYGGTYAHKDIALEFCSWLSPKFKVALLKTFRMLMEREAERRNIGWHLRKITNNIDEVRNLLDTIPGQHPDLSRLQGGERNWKINEICMHIGHISIIICNPFGMKNLLRSFLLNGIIYIN